MSEHIIKTNSGTVVQDPPLARLLFSDTRLSVVWAVIRVLLGWAWLEPGLSKLGNPAWMAGDALKGYWTNQITVPATGHAPIAFGWYRDFIQSLLDSGSYVWFAKLVAIGEFGVGVLLIVGAFVGIAAFFGAFMNWNYIMAGSASSNGLLLIASIALILAWKTAGYYGADRFLLPYIGTPWARKTASTAAQTPAREIA
jgi:thiosulfate dehydrogenase [quinone] large subunit